MVRVFIIRHGETNPNKRNECLGLNDVELNGSGVMQAGRLALRMDKIFVDAAYTSPLSRAYHSARPFVGRNLSLKQIPYIVEPALTERDWGDWEGMTLDEIARRFPEEYAKFEADKLNYVVPGGESSAAVQDRVDEFLDRIMPEYEGGAVCLSTHLGTARHCISHLLGLRPEDSWRFWMDNATYAEIEYDSETKTGVLKKLGC